MIIYEVFSSNPCIYCDICNSLRSDTLNAVGRCPKFDNNALMVRSNKSRINYSYYPYSIVYTTGQIKKLPDTWCDATEFVDGLALVMDKPSKKVFYRYFTHIYHI